MLGDQVKQLLFGSENAIGQQIYIGQTPFLVVGVMQPKTQTSSYYARDADRIFIPASTFRVLFGNRYVTNLVYRPVDPDLSPQVKQAVYTTLGRRYHFDPADEDALGMWDTNEADRFVKYFFLGFNLFLGLIGSFTLTVGGIGVANICGGAGAHAGDRHQTSRGCPAPGHPGTVLPGNIPDRSDRRIAGVLYRLWLHPDSRSPAAAGSNRAP